MSGAVEMVCLPLQCFLPPDLSPAICEAATNVGRRRSNAAQELMIAIEAGCTGNREGGALDGLMVESLVHTSKYKYDLKLLLTLPQSHPTLSIFELSSSTTRGISSPLPPERDDGGGGIAGA